MTDRHIPHLTELLDLTAVVEAGTLAMLRQVMRANGDDPDTAATVLAEMRVVDRQRLRSDVLAVVYAGARAVAEQAYAQGWRDGQVEYVARRQQAGGADLVDDSVGNPFADGRVLT